MGIFKMTMQVDYTILFNTILGGIITISGSLAIAFIYIRSQNKNRKKERLTEIIRQNYFEQGIGPVMSSLSEYGTITTFALADASISLGRFSTSIEEFKSSLLEISKRPVLQDLISHNYANISKWLPCLHKFGPAVHTSILRTLQLYSSLSMDAISHKVLLRTAKDSSANEVARSLGVMAQIIDMTLSFLEKRFLNLQDYLLMQDIETYTDFLKLFSKEEYGKFLSVMEQYKDGITQLMKAMKSRDNQERANTTRSFSKWLDDNMEPSPLAQ